jgi:quinolinate synthase
MSSFPSLIIRADTLLPQGSFAEAQAMFLNPESEEIDAMDLLLRKGNIGVVSHFYMDAELQGVLSACSWEHIQISDSLVMADKAVAMAEAGISSIVVLGVDFMSENVRAVLDAAGFHHIPVYRVVEQEIGCSLAASAEARAYGAWLDQAAESRNPLHVIYINTSLQVKAKAQLKVPTITCTSSNVVQTLLQAASQIPELSLWYGPDTYMGRNLEQMLHRFSQLAEEEIRRIHPDHSRASLKELLTRFNYFKQGSCAVHHMFGEEVVSRVQKEHPNAYYTAHLEVPGEMFALAAEAQEEERGVVGSTSNILSFIIQCLEAAALHQEEQTISVVLGTEAGMITSIVRKVQALLKQLSRDNLAVEIIFPVAGEAIAQDDSFGVVPGVAGGEGCSTAGGCATCPYMKMNSLEALNLLVEQLNEAQPSELTAYHPKSYTELLSGRTAAELGGEPILSMRHFQRTGSLPSSLVHQVIS